MNPYKEGNKFYCCDVSKPLDPMNGRYLHDDGSIQPETLNSQNVYTGYYLTVAQIIDVIEKYHPTVPYTLP